MTATDNTLPLALDHIPGLWENPITKNTYHLKKGIGNNYARMEVLQRKSGVKIIFAYKIIYDNKILYIEIDHMLFDVTEVSYDEPMTMKIKNPGGHIMMLQKIVNSAK